jgi:hypothetical protein
MTIDGLQCGYFTRDLFAISQGGAPLCVRPTIWFRSVSIQAVLPPVACTTSKRVLVRREFHGYTGAQPWAGSRTGLRGSMEATPRSVGAAPRRRSGAWHRSRSPGRNRWSCPSVA